MRPCNQFLLEEWCLGTPVLAGTRSNPFCWLSRELSLNRTFSLSPDSAQFSLQKLTNTKIQIALSLKAAET
jgi:hypothetical protein